MPTMTPSAFEQQIAQVHGIMRMSNVQGGVQPLEAQRMRPSFPTAEFNGVGNTTCPNCGYTATSTQNIQSHLAACVRINRNRYGARWDNDLDSAPHPPVLKRKRNDSDEGASIATTTTTPQKRAAYASKPQEQRDERQRVFHERLAAVNGVVIPSTLAPGQVPQPKNPEREDCKYQCPICRGWHKRRYHVQSHFAKCVEMYGNPNGARWDDTWKDVAYRANRGSPSVSEPQSHQSQAPWPEAYRLADTQFDDSATGKFQLNGYQHHSVSSESNGFENQQPDLDYGDPPVMFNPLNSLEHYDPEFSHFDPRLRPCSSDNLEPHDANLGMGSLTNGALLSRFQHWQEVIRDGQAHLQQTMKELEHRGMLDANGTWVVDPGRVNMALTRGQYSGMQRNGPMW